MLKKFHTALVEQHALRGQVVRAHDSGISPGVTTTQVAFFDHRDAPDAVLGSQVVGAGESMSAPPDDHHIVGITQGVGGVEKTRFCVISIECVFDETK